MKIREVFGTGGRYVENRGGICGRVQLQEEGIRISGAWMKDFRNIGLSIARIFAAGKLPSYDNAPPLAAPNINFRGEEGFEKRQPDWPGVGI